MSFKEIELQIAEPCPNCEGLGGISSQDFRPKLITAQLMEWLKLNKLALLPYPEEGGAVCMVCGGTGKQEMEELILEEK